MQYPNGLSVENAVGLLMPLAIQIRNTNIEGSAQLQISPDTVFIQGGQLNIVPTLTGSESVTFSGFTAPEVYKGYPADKVSDVYSFTALFYYVLTGITPVNALARTDNQIQFPSTVSDENIKNIVEKGLALDISDRYISLDSIIEELNPYYRVPDNIPAISEIHNESRPENENYNPDPKNPLFKRFYFIIPVCIVFILGSLCGIHFFKYSKAKTLAANGDFAGANNIMPMQVITKLHDPSLSKYITAGLSRSNRQYEEAREQFDALGNYMNSVSLSRECLADYASQLINKNEYDKAIEVYSQLKDLNYPNVDYLNNTALYRKGIYLLKEQNEFKEAEGIFKNLINKKYDGAEDMLNETMYCWALDYADKGEYITAYRIMIDIPQYKDTADCIETLKELIYEKGIDEYRAGEYIKAKITFADLDETYQDVSAYRALIQIHDIDYFTEYTYSSVKNNIKQYMGFEDMNEVIVSYGFVATEFLSGSWKTPDGSYYFEIGDDRSAGYNIPCSEEGDYYSIEDGIYFLYNARKMQTSRKDVFEITVISYDCIEIYAYANGSVYTLYRQ